MGRVSGVDPGVIQRDGAATAMQTDKENQVSGKQNRVFGRKGKKKKMETWWGRPGQKKAKVLGCPQSLGERAPKCHASTW